MDLEGEIEKRRPERKLVEIAARSEHEHFLAVEIHVEIAHQSHRACIGILEDVAHVVHPCIQVVFALDALVFPVGGDAGLGYLVHASGAYLHFHPFVLRAEHRDVQRLVAVAFRHRQPVFQSRRVGLIHVGDNRIGGPALALLMLAVNIENDAYRKQIIDLLHVIVLLHHLVPDGIDGFGTAFDFEFQALTLERLLHRADKRFDIGVAAALGGVELGGYAGEHLAVGIFQRQVLKLAFDLV